MRRIELKAYNGQWHHRGLLAKLRRKILNAVRQGECLLIDVEGVVGLTPAELGIVLALVPRTKLRIVGVASLRTVSTANVGAGRTHSGNAHS